MKIPLPIATFLATTILGAFLSACDSQSTATGPSGSDTRGSLAFALPAAVRAQVATTADSLKVELHHGALVHTASAALDSSIRVDGIEPGRWSLQVGLYDISGILHWYGEDSVTVAPGEVTRADITLRPATGSVDIVIHLEDSTAISADSLLGQWYLLGVDSTAIHNRSISLTFGDTSHFYGSDGCNSIIGAYASSPTTLRIQAIGSTRMYCKDSLYPSLDIRVESALGSIRTWKIASGVLSLSDSTGKVRLRYGQTPPIPVAPLPPLPVVTDSIVAWISVDSNTDTTGLLLAPVRIDSALVSDSGVLLVLTLPHPGSDLHLFALDSGYRPAPSLFVDTVVTDTGILLIKSSVPSPNIPHTYLVAGVDATNVFYAQHMVSAIVRVPWSAIGPQAKFIGRSGGEFIVQRPGLDID